MTQSTDSGGSGRAGAVPLPRNILIVDDDPFIRRIVATVLGEENGARVTATASASEALSAMAASRPDLVLLDLVMPDVDGRAAFALFKRHCDPLPPIIFLTARDDPDEARDLRALGALGVILKPFDPRAIADAVRGLLSRSPQSEAGARRSERLDAIGLDFRNRLPITIAALICDFDVLTTSGWNAAVAESLLTKAHTLAGSAGLFKLNAVGESAAMVEAAIAPLIKAGRAPAPDDMKRVASALAVLSETAAVVAAAPVKENGAG